MGDVPYEPMNTLVFVQNCFLFRGRIDPKSESTANKKWVLQTVTGCRLTFDIRITHKSLLDVRQVHPRVCGGDRPSRESAEGSTGPSPRVRGRHARVPELRSPQGSIPACAGETAMDEWEGVSHIRSIPACAGETGRTGRCQSRAWVHPRVCGGDPMPPCANLPIAREFLPQGQARLEASAGWNTGKCHH
jgi:hypothetical protein